MKDLFKSEDIGSILTYKNTNSTVFFSPRTNEDAILHKLPIELPIDLSPLTDSFQGLFNKLKQVQDSLDIEFDSNRIKNEVQDHQFIYQKTDLFHSVYPVIHSINNQIGYTLNHEIYDSFDIYSNLSKLLGIKVEDFYAPVTGITNILDIIHIKPYTTLSYHIHRPFNDKSSSQLVTNLDGVECMIVLNGDMRFYASTHPKTVVVEKYEGILPKHKIVAFNPEILHTGVALTEDVYILYLRFNNMRFTNFLKKR
jgi:tellurite resistance-related uncharacterized protein